MAKKVKVYHVEPLRTAEEINQMRWAIRRGNKSTPKRPTLVARDELLFLIGINTGLRANDLVRLKVRDVKDRNIFMIREGKTKKRREINITMLREEVDCFITDKRSEEFLFQSQKGSKAISPTQVYRILNDAADLLERSDVGSHTLRKTFGYHHYKQFRDVAILQEIFNHESPSVTRRYIGIRQDEINESLATFRLG